MLVDSRHRVNLLEVMYASPAHHSNMRGGFHAPHPAQVQQFHGPPFGSPIRYHGYGHAADLGHGVGALHHHHPPLDGSPSPSQARFSHYGRENKKQASDDGGEDDGGEDDRWQEQQWRESPRGNGGGGDQNERAMLRKISILKGENRKMTEQLDNTKNDNARLEAYSSELRKKLESTRSALKDSRDSLEKVQAAIKPLMQNQRTRDEQHQQLVHLNRMYETKLRENEERLRVAELVSTQKTTQLEKDASGASEDNLLIEKLHERLLASQNQLIKVQSELQRSQIEKASMASELAESQRKISSLDVQLLMTSQSHTQRETAKHDEYKAKENSWRVQLDAANRQVAVLEERLALESQIRDQDRKEDEQMRENSLNVDVASAMRRINNIEQQQTLDQKAQNLRTNATYAMSGSGGPSSRAAAPANTGRGNLSEMADQVSAEGYAEDGGDDSEDDDGDEDDEEEERALEEFEEEEDDGFHDIKHSLRSGGPAAGSGAVEAGTSNLNSYNEAKVEDSVDSGAAEEGGGDGDGGEDEFDTHKPAGGGEDEARKKKKMKGLGVNIIDPADMPSEKRAADEGEVEEDPNVNKPVFFRPESVVVDDLKEAKAGKESLRQEIKEWMAKFAEEHSREPTHTEKKQGLGKHTFVKYHKMQESVEKLTQELDQVKNHLAALPAETA